MTHDRWLMLRHPGRGLGRAVLMLFLAALAIGVAAPLVGTPVGQVVCSANGVVSTVAGADDDSAAAAAGHAIECPMCWLLAPPATMVGALATPLLPGGRGVARWLPAPSLLRAAPPLPARGPPPTC